MGWPYHFVSLTNPQKLQRRELLDFYATLAQFSILIPILLLQCIFLAQWIERRWRKQSDLEAPSSPYLKVSRKGGRRLSLRDLRVGLRRWKWWAGGEVEILGQNWGRRGEVMLAGVWMGWLVVLCFLQTGDDYLHLTKRFGIVAASQLPFHYLLALKSPFSPLQYLTRSSHESLNAAHQHLGRIATVLFYSHTALYLNFFIQSNLLAQKIQQVYIIAGIVGTIAFTAIGTSSLAQVRRRSYKIFYTVHVILATALLPVLWFHVSHIRIYLYETAAVYLFNAILRFFTTKRYAAELRLVPGTEGKLLEIRIPLQNSATSSTATNWQPGQHAYISLPSHPFLRTFRSNPFTLASMPTVDKNLRFVARVLDGNTRTLASTASKTTTQPLTLEGPYGLSTHPLHLLSYDRVLFVAGGVGGTFITPLCRQLLSDLSPSKGAYRRQKVDFVWIARSRTEVEGWALPDQKGEREGFVERLKVYVTRDSEVAGVEGESAFAHAGAVAAAGEGEDGIEMEERKNLLSEDRDEGEANGQGEMRVSPGKPNLRRLVDETFSHGSAERVAVLICGPKTLSRALRKEVGRWVDRGRDVWYWEEVYGL